LSPAGVDPGLIAVALRGRGIFVEDPITFLPRLPCWWRNPQWQSDGAVKLRLNAILGGRYILAGEDIRDEDVPPSIAAKYAISSTEAVPKFRQQRANADPSHFRQKQMKKRKA
jgi:hypothetical protein